MFGLFNKARTEVGSVGGFGKVAELGDFVRTPGASDEMVAFEAWLTRAMQSGEARGGVAFREAFAAGPSYAFVWCGALEKKGRGALVGIVTPSADSVGRKFPVVVGAPVPLAALSAHPHVAPLVLHDFFHHALAAASRAARVRSQAEFAAQIAAIAKPSFDRVAAEVSTYAKWAKCSRAADVWSSLFGADAELGSRYALAMLVEATATYRGQDAPPLTLGARVPLGADRRTTAAMWIDLVRQAAGWKATVPTFFVPLAGPSEALIQLGAEAPAGVLADLYAPSKGSDAVFDVTAPSGSLPPSLPPSVARATAAATISDVCAELAR